MKLKIDQQTMWLVGGVLGLLALASVIGFVLARTAKSDEARKVVSNLNARTRAWWMMVAVFGFALATGGLGSVILFGLTSFWALREFMTLTPSRPGDHRTLFLAFFVVTPLQYYLVAVNWYGLFSVMIPVYAFLLLAIRAAAAGDCEAYLTRTAKIQWGLMICVYCVSYAPAILGLPIRGYEGQNGKLLFWFVLVDQISDVFQYVWGKLFGRHKIAPTVSPNKTWEGFVGGIISATLVGGALHVVTPFSFWEAIGLGLAITFMGFGGGLVMSAIKRDRGVKDYGTAIAGHGGILDRIDSLCFAAPIFFHLTRYFFAAQ